jgi:hypothetical protein
MKVTKKMYALLAGIFILTVIFIFINRTGAKANKNPSCGASATKFNIQPIALPQAKTTPDVNILPSIPAMPTAREMQTQNNVIANFPDLDRAPLDDESISLLPANEMIANNYKDWYGSGAGASVDKELYAKGNPLFTPSDKAELVPPDVNSEKRRVNFY